MNWLGGEKRGTGQLREERKDVGDRKTEAGHGRFDTILDTTKGATRGNIGREAKYDQRSREPSSPSVQPDLP